MSDKIDGPLQFGSVVIFCRTPKTVRAKPAMEAVISDQLWFLDEMTALL
jgi:hypothetical protein